jgi:hypothetical protein
MSVISSVTKPDGSVRTVVDRWATSISLAMNPIGTMRCFLAACSSRLRARSRAASSSNGTCPNLASALRTCDASWIGRRRLPPEST